MNDRFIFYTYVTSLTGGFLFSYLHIPIPWILGPVTAIVLIKYFFKLETRPLPGARDAAFTILGIQIGLTFNTQTFTYIFPFLIPYTLLSLCMIFLSVLFGLWISRLTNLDQTTSLVGSAPGGLSTMIAVSESLNGNSSLVTIFHTLRLLSVLFIIPFFVTHMVQDSSNETILIETISPASGTPWSILLYLLVFVLGWKGQDHIPASLVIVPMLTVGVIQTLGFSLFQLPDFMYMAAQLLIGTYLGHTISLRDIFKAGKTCLYFLTLAIVMISIGILLSYLFAFWTGVELITAVLSLAPGGLVEMAITAEQAGGQPAIVSSLQTIRLLTIILLLPLVFKKVQNHFNP